MWTLLPGNKLRGAIDAVHDGYVGWGQGPGSGRTMVPGNGIIVKTDSSAASGASVSDYHLGGYQTSAVTHPSAWTVSDLQAAAGSGGRLMAAFTLTLDESHGNAASFPIIYTMGAVANGVLLPHDSSNGNSATLDLTTASLTGVASGSDRRSGDLPTVHGWLAATGWGLLLPLAAAIARTLREYPKVWFNLHRWIALLGYCIGIAGIAIGYYMKPFMGSEETAHVVLGSLALAFGFLQILALLGRPAPDHKYRWVWRVYHTSIGRLLVAVVIANFYLGVHMSNNIANDNRKNWYFVYSVLLGAIFAVAFAKEIYNLVTSKRHGKRAGEGHPTGSLNQGRSNSSLHDSAYNDHSGRHNGYNSAAAV